MPAPYSYDLRSKAIEAIKRGEKKIHVSRLFKISRNTLDLWLKKERETEDYPYGYSLKGERCYSLKSGKRTERISWISALKEDKLLAPLTFEGSCNRDLFEAWLQNCLIPQLEPGDLLIIDNASFHKGEYIKEIITDAGCEIWYLPPYSPDLNKIENWWAVLKTWMRQRKLGGVGFRPAKVFKKRLKEFKTVRECVDAAFKNCQGRMRVAL